MMKNRDVLSFGFDEYLMNPTELTIESGKNGRNEGCNKRLVKFDEWKDETDAMLRGDERTKDIWWERGARGCLQAYLYQNLYKKFELIAHNFSTMHEQFFFV